MGNRTKEYEEGWLASSQQSDWRNECPYEKDTQQYKDWMQGALDSEISDMDMESGVPRW